MGRQTTFDLSLGYYFSPGNSLGLELLLDIGVGYASIAGTSGQVLNGQLTQGALSNSFYSMEAENWGIPFRLKYEYKEAPRRFLPFVSQACRPYASRQSRVAWVQLSTRTLT